MRERFLLNGSTEGATPGVGMTSPPVLFSPMTAAAAASEVALAVTVTVLTPCSRHVSVEPRQRVLCVRVGGSILPE